MKWQVISFSLQSISVNTNYDNTVTKSLLFREKICSVLLKQRLCLNGLAIMSQHVSRTLFPSCLWPNEHRRVEKPSIVVVWLFFFFHWAKKSQLPIHPPPLQMVLWRYKFSQLKGSSDDGKTRVKLLFKNAESQQIEMKVKALRHCKTNAHDAIL